MMKLLCVFAAFVFLGGWLFASGRPRQIEHGWRTSLVIVERTHSDIMGWGIRARFPNHCGRSDDPRIADVIAAHGGSVWQMGGFPCAPVFASFRTKTKGETDVKAREVVPPLHALMETLR